MKRFVFLFALLVFALYGLQAQEMQITGNVTSFEDGSALPGVSVVVKGTTLGTVTDFEGSYSIAVPEGATTLIFSFVGMQTREVAIGTSRTINVAMETDAIRMDEVVVVGYGTSTREASTGSVAVVHSDEIQDIPEVSFDKMLAGKVAGVHVTAQSGQPGAASQMRIRGASSLYAGNEPLYIVDGIPVMSGDLTYFTNTGNALAAINPNDIESISVLKDAAAASVYGSRASNGVVIITTKSGAAGKSKVNFRASYGISSLTNDRKIDVLTPEQLIEYKRAAVINVGMDPDDPSGAYYTPYSILEQPMNNWMKAVTRLGNLQDYELSVTGGNDKTKHYTSAAYGSNEGVFPGIDYTKYQLRSNIDHAISDKLSMGVKLNAFHSKQNDVAMQSLYYVNPIFAAVGILPWTPIKNEDGTYNLRIPEWANSSPLATAEHDDQWELQNNLMGTAYIEWEPIPGLKFKTNNSVKFVDGEGRRYWSPEADYAGTATLQVSRTKRRGITSSNTASYTKYINNHNLNLLAGFEANDYQYNAYYIYSPNVDPSIPFPNTATAGDDDADYSETEYGLLSFFGIADYNYDNRYYFRASLRTDGSSRFGANNRWGTFYSVGASWNLHNEAFLDNINAINLLKLRASYGISGNDRIGDFEHWGVYSSREYNGVSGMAPDRPANPDLTWELSTSYNVGVDFGLLNRVSGTIEYYYRLTSDMLLDVPLSYTSGFASLRQNVGELKNSGVEALVNVNILNGSVRWNVGANLGANRSEILDLAGQEEIISGRFIHRVGESFLNYYLFDFAGVNPVNGEALWYKHIPDPDNPDDETVLLTNLYSEASKIIAGSPEPKFLGGINTDVAWKGFNLSANLEYKWGNKVSVEELRYLSSDGNWWNNNQFNLVMDYWKEPGDLTKTPKPLAYNTTNSYGYYNTRWMYDGSYLRIKNVTLAYSLPANLVKKMKLANLRIYGSAVNAFTFHKVDFWDPERGESGLEFGMHPMTKSFVIGLDLTF
ncbi:MAG: TonB-dependent receptor [Bacteroidales bacterium]|nr:TonB-dependent receptor [Bacteroidales bacterium]